MELIDNRLTKLQQIYTLLALFVIAASLYSIITPLFEMSDELWHYPMVKTLADGNGLPVQDPENVGPWRQEGSQPPLYYWVGAAATFWIDTSDMHEVRRVNPHVDNGLITADGNNNLIVHNYEKETWPWRGTTLAVHIVRFLSVLMSIGTVYFTYLIGLEVFPERHRLALAGAAVVAFTPMFTFISGAVNNDNLSILLASASLWMMFRIIRVSENNEKTLLLSIILGVLLGLGALTKVSGLGLFGLAGLTMAYAAFTEKRWQIFWIEGPIIIGIAAAIAGWWYLRNLQLYGDPLGLNAFIAVLGQRARPATLAQLWSERAGFMQSYWGLFGGVNIPMPDWIYTTLNIAGIIGAVGIIPVCIQKYREDGFNLSDWVPTLLSFLMVLIFVVPLVVGWARTTWSSQGRLVFYAISSISLWFIVGIDGWLPEKLRQPVTLVVISFMAALTFAAPFAWIAPAYQTPEHLLTLAGHNPVNFFVAGSERASMRLVDATVATSEVLPGETVRVTLIWGSLQPMDRQWSTFIHLRDNADLLAGQRDTYPGLGLLATTDLEPGYKWQDEYAIEVLEFAYAPETLDIIVGLYDYTTCPACERMVTEDNVTYVNIGTVNLLPREGPDLPNPVSVNFGDELELRGYTVDHREAAPGETITLTLFWQGLQVMENDYTISAQILAEDTTRYAQEDSWPHDGAFPTSSWDKGEQVEDHYSLTLNPDTPAGIYWMQVAVYWQTKPGQFDRLQRITADGRLADDFVLLTRIRVTE